MSYLKGHPVVGGGKIRSSNIEILRILATFFILFIHANFWSIGKPAVNDFSMNPADAWCRALFEAAGIIAVNCFVFISGWFGIHFKLRGLVNFLFQCLFFYVGTTVIMTLAGICDFTRIVIARTLFVDNWYILSYVLLLIMSPVLNAFIENASRKTYRLSLILFWGFALTFGYFSPVSTFSGGYSPIFFMGLYLLVRYIRIYKPKFSTFPLYVDLLIYLICTVLIACILRCFGISCYTYLNPLVIVSSIYFSLIFTKFEFKNNVVNCFAASSFAAYLLHTSPCLRDFYQTFFHKLWESNPTATFWIDATGVIVAIMLLAVVIDQLRIVFYRWTIAKVDIDGVCDRLL